MKDAGSLESSVWVPDPGIGGVVDWWGGDNWWAGEGSWSWSGSTATFMDKPSFLAIPSRRNSPAYYNVDFYSFVLDACKPGSPELAHISWGVFIYYPESTTGYEISW